MRYFIVTFVRKVSGQIDEQVQIAKKLIEDDLTMANIILDFKEKKVKRCIIDGREVPTNYEAIVNHYRDVYPEYIEQLEKDQESGNDE